MLPCIVAHEGFGSTVRTIHKSLTRYKAEQSTNCAALTPQHCRQQPEVDKYSTTCIYMYMHVMHMHYINTHTHTASLAWPPTRANTHTHTQCNRCSSSSSGRIDNNPTPTKHTHHVEASMHHHRRQAPSAHPVQCTL